MSPFSYSIQHMNWIACNIMTCPINVTESQPHLIWKWTNDILCHFLDVKINYTINYSKPFSTLSSKGHRFRKDVRLDIRLHWNWNLLWCPRTCCVHGVWMWIHEYVICCLTWLRPFWVCVGAGDYVKCCKIKKRTYCLGWEQMHVSAKLLQHTSLAVHWKHHAWLSCLVSMAHAYMIHVPRLQTCGFPRAGIKSSFHTSRTRSGRRPHQRWDGPKKRENQS